MSVGGCFFCILEASEQERMMETLKSPPLKKKFATQFLTHTIATMLAGLKGQLRLPQLNVIPRRPFCMFSTCQFVRFQGDLSFCFQFATSTSTTFNHITIRRLKLHN